MAGSFYLCYIFPMTILRAFPTQIYMNALGAQPKGASPEALRRQLLKECFQVAEEDRAGQAWSKDNYANGFTSYASANDMHRRSSTFTLLEKRIDQHVKKFVRALDMDVNSKHLRMSTCWVNIMPSQAAHGAHIHPLSVISGTYYVDIPKQASVIKFEDPRLDRMMAAPPKRAHAKAHNKLFVEIAPKAGQIVLFESWLRHEVPVNKSRTPRVSVSFNYEYCE
jgi:uncharacterized protein (TIGR02466 family)